MDEVPELRAQAQAAWERKKDKELTQRRQDYSTTFNSYVSHFLGIGPLDADDMVMSEDVVDDPAWAERLATHYFGVTLLFDHTVASKNDWQPAALRAVEPCGVCGHQVVVNPPAASMADLGEALDRGRPDKHHCPGPPESQPHAASSGS